ncbi:MAG: M14 family zinc carboxypeptidase [Nitrosopumilus sp.]|nr:M14 family zinc carboxypeptidase [Nitrosopumilus sp.]
MSQTVIGKSFLGKPLTVDFIGNRKSSLKIFIIAGQHGDEKYSKEAVIKLAEYFKPKTKLSFHAAVLYNANPDGYENNSRMNAQSIDLNRDHLLLQSKETEAIHNFVREWMPQIVIDIHNYPSRRRHLLKKHLIINQDIFIDIPTNLAVIQPLNNNKIKEFFTKIKSDLNSKGFSCERYVLFQKSGKIRHSTLDVKDARNSLAMRYGVFSIILEGREPLKKEGILGKNKTIMGQFHALGSVIDYLVKNRNEFESKPHVSTQGELVPIQSKYRNSNERIELEVKDSKTKKTKKKKFKNYSPDVESLKFVDLPTSYAVPNSMKKLIKLLQKHGFSSSSNNKINEYEMYYKISEKSPTKQLKKKTISNKISNYSVFPVNQLGGRFLALLLEPQSKFGLNRFSELKLDFSKNLEFPIIRI